MRLIFSHRAGEDYVAPPACGPDFENCVARDCGGPQARLL
jgi:hypothetical protein